MLDPIIISYKLTINLSVTYSRIQQYPVKYIYNSKNINFIKTIQLDKKNTEKYWESNRFS